MDKKQLVVEYLTTMAEITNKELSEASIFLYWKILKDYDYKTLDTAFIELLKTMKFFPKPSEILNAIKGDTESKPLSAWLKVHDAIRKYGHYYTIDFNDPIIVKTIQHLGGWSKLCSTNTDEMVWIQKEFERIYKNFMGQKPDCGTKIEGFIEKQNKLNGHFDAMPKAILLTENRKEIKRKKVIEG